MIHWLDIALGGYGLYSGLICLLIARRFIRNMGALPPRCTPPPGTRVAVIIPLLDERRILLDTYRRFKFLVEQDEALELFYVTTEREALQHPQRPATADMLRSLMEADPNQRIHALHYPDFNYVVADQLNLAIAQVLGRRAFSHVAIFNADSVISGRALTAFYVTSQSHQTASAIYQQSSLFLSNVPDLIRARHYILAAFGMYQSCWTLRREVPHYLLDSWLPSIGMPQKYHLVYCVGHGLFISTRGLEALYPIPNLRLGGEDLAVGYLAKLNGLTIATINDLENSDTPRTLRSLFRQLTQWYIATLGYVTYFRRLRRDGRPTHHIALTLQGILLHPVKWVLRGPCILALLFLAVAHDHLLTFVIAYVMYAYLPLVPLLYLWFALPRSRFPAPPPAGLILAAASYGIVPILRSAPALWATFICVKMICGVPFVKQKTEMDDED